MTIIEAKDYEKWFLALTAKEQTQVAKRLKRIQDYGELGDFKNIGEGLCELRWKNGWRVYFIRITGGMILLVGGHKNDQKKDIKKARNNVSRFTYH